MNKKTLEKFLPNTHPLKDFPYWNSPDGKNLNAIACLEWLKAYIVIMQTELPCEENNSTLWFVNMALKEQQNRIQRRKEQKVLGTDTPHKYTDISGLSELG